MNTKHTLIVVAAFALGCAAARTFVVPPARAQGTARWEYFCFEDRGREDVAAKANWAGRQGWEMAGVGGVERTMWCFKRAK